MSMAGSGGRAAPFRTIQYTGSSLWTLGFFLVFIGGAYLRLRGLTVQSYWDDELFSAIVSSPDHSLWQVVRLTVSDVHPPLFQLLLWLWFKIVGFSELTGRLFPSLFGIFALPVLYRIGCEVGSRAVGFGAAMLCAVNVFHLYYSQEMRSYTMMFFLGTLSLLYFVRLLNDPQRKNLVCWLLASVAMMYTHFFGVLALAAECATLLFLLRTTPALRRPTAIAAGWLGVAILPMVPLVVRNAGLAGFWIASPTADFAIGYFLEYFGSHLLAGSVVLAMLYGAFQSGVSERSTNVLRLFVLWLAMVLLLPYIRSLVSVPMLTARNTIIALPVVFLLAALGIAAIREPVARGLLLFSLFALSTLQIFYHPPYYRTIFKPQVREAAQALIAAHPDADAVYAPADVVGNFNVYFALYDAPFRVRPLPAQDGSVALPARFWLVDGRAGAALNEPIMKSPRVRVVQRKDFRNSGFVVLEPVR